MIRFPPKKILVPFDLSEASMTAWEEATALSRRFGSSLEALYVEPWLSAEAWVMQGALTPERRRDILKQVRAAIGAGPKVSILDGDPIVNVLRLARKRQPHLIVMGTHGRTGLELIRMGSVAEAVARLSPVPVLAARGVVRPRRSVLAPVTLDDYSEYAFAYAAGVAAALKARLTLFHAAPDPARCGEVRLRLSGLIKRLPADVQRVCKPRLELVRGRAPQAILDAAQEHDLVVLAAHKMSSVKELVLGTTAERVLRHSPVPVLSVPAPERPFALGSWGLARKWVKV